MKPTKRHDSHRRNTIRGQHLAYFRDEECFRYPTTEKISEISCGEEPARWQGDDQPVDSDGPGIAIAS